MILPDDTDRIRFRAYEPEDFDDVVRMFSDLQARRFYPEMDKPENNRRWIEWNLNNYHERGFGLWVIEDPHSGQFLGDCGLSFQPVEGAQVLELGYHLVERHRGHGLVTEAGQQCLSYGFNVLATETICSLVHPENLASKAVAERLHPHRRTYLKPDGTERLIFWTEAATS